MTQCVDVKSYQEVAAELGRGKKPESLLEGYMGVCFDEAHYFFSDSDFNGFGTYTLLLALMYAGIDKQLIFLSATLDVVYPYIQEVLQLYQRFLPSHLVKNSFEDNWFKEFQYDYSYLANYEHVECIAVPDLETMCACLVESDKKSIVFTDDRNRIEKIYDLLHSTFSIEAKEIVCLNADILDSQEANATVKDLALANKLSQRFLLTTSVLDNGVSIKDPSVGNIVIITESEVSFLQMMGRLRKEQSEKVKLYFLIRNADFFERREKDYQHQLDWLEGIEKKRGSSLEILTTVWNGETEFAELYKKFFVPGLWSLRCIGEDNSCRGISGDIRMVINHLSREKVGDAFVMASRFHKLAREDEKNVIFEQMKLLGKEPRELKVVDSTYKAKLMAEFIDDLENIQEYSLDKFSEKKKTMAKKYGSALFSSYSLRNRSFSTEVFETIIADYGYSLVVNKSPDRKNLYSVHKVIACEANVNDVGDNE